MFKQIIRWIDKAAPVKRMRGGHINLKSGNVLRLPADTVSASAAASVVATVLGIGRQACWKIVGNQAVVWCER